MDLLHARAVQRLSSGPAAPESCPSITRPINLVKKQAGKLTAGNPHGGFDAAGIGTGLTVQLVRPSQRKRGATDRLDLRGTAPVLDPTSGLGAVEGRGAHADESHDADSQARVESTDG